jgi:hypothetical protein
MSRMQNTYAIINNSQNYNNRNISRNINITLCAYKRPLTIKCDESASSLANDNALLKPSVGSNPLPTVVSSSNGAGATAQTIGI